MVYIYHRPTQTAFQGNLSANPLIGKGRDVNELTFTGTVYRTTDEGEFVIREYEFSPVLKLCDDIRSLSTDHIQNRQYDVIMDDYITKSSLDGYLIECAIAPRLKNGKLDRFPFSE